MAKHPAPTSAISWWLDPPPVTGWFRRCLDQFDVRLSRRHGKTGLPRQNEAAAQKLARVRSGNASAARAGLRKQGFGISERHVRSR